MFSGKFLILRVSMGSTPIAIAATQGMDYLVTWNFKHINNASTRTMVVNVVSNSGLVCPVLCSPEELMGEDDA